MNYNECAPDPEPAPEQAALIAGLTASERGDIDRCILSVSVSAEKRLREWRPYPCSKRPSRYEALPMFIMRFASMRSSRQ